ncbi:PLP-dependent transferase [Acinetobacter sp. MD2]|uniref:PLP-dependent transferase n=1 Tax=Acinetobacter sp. MD2 TaxID=2600066 RepID=UPI002D1EED03|nr:PLP-dependent transferase [Acinetobacter sp. MD2]MEB3767150.1 PLP-dependent transferase [Acinetobacter sp. MD2]
MKKSSQTARIHAPRRAPQYIETIQPPLYRASSIFFKNTQQLYERKWSDPYDYSYGTHGTPTTYTLADQIAQLEHGKFCLLAPSGLSAIQLVNATFLTSHDEVWIPDNLYGPNVEYLNYLHSAFTIDVRIYNPTDLHSFQPSKKAKLLWMEAAGSVTLEFPDLIGLVKKAQQHQVLTVLDNTWGAGLAFNPFDFSEQHLAVDVSVHALTKYPSGGGDILMGSVVTQDHALHLKLLRMHALQGISISGDDAAQIMRSLPHMQLRYEQQSRSAIQILAWLKQQPHFTQILHPSDAESPGHQHWQQVCTTQQSAGLISMIFNKKYSFSEICRFCDQLKLFKLGFSWGGPISLVMLYDIKNIRQLPTPHLSEGYLVRLCIGLESTDDLIHDIQQALQSLE